MPDSYANDGAVSLEPPCNRDELVELAKVLEAKFKAVPVPARPKKVACQGPADRW